MLSSAHERGYRQGVETIPLEIEQPIAIALGVYAGIALIITRGVIADVGLTPLQRFFQTLLVWLVPVFGMSLVLLMQGAGHTREEMKKLVPFPFYLVAGAGRSDGSLAGIPHDGAGDSCGADAADGD